MRILFSLTPEDYADAVRGLYKPTHGWSVADIVYSWEFFQEDVRREYGQQAIVVQVDFLEGGDVHVVAAS